MPARLRLRYRRYQDIRDPKTGRAAHSGPPHRPGRWPAVPLPTVAGGGYPPSVRLQLTLADPAPAGGRDDVILEADPETPVDDVVAELGRIRPGRMWVDGTRVEGAGRVGDSVLRDGTVVTVVPPTRHDDLLPPPTVPSGHAAGVHSDGPGRGARRGDAALEVAVTGGPAAGRTFPITGPEMVVGRDASAHVRLEDAASSRRHAVLRATASAGPGPVGWLIEDLGSVNGTWVDGARIDGPAPVGPGTVIEVGSSVLEVRPPVPADADVHPGDDATLAFNRPPRLGRSRQNVKVSPPPPPSDTEPMPFPWIGALAPLAMGAVLYAVTKSVETLLFIGLSPIYILSSTLTNRRQGRRRGQRDIGTWRERMAQARKRIDDAVAEEVDDERRRWSDPAVVAETVAAPGRRIWERREYDLDALVLRVGVADRPAQVTVDERDAYGPSAPAHHGRRRPRGPRAELLTEPPLLVPTLHAMPVPVSLKAAGVLGVAGPPGRVRAVARWLVGQLAVWHTPRAVQVVVLSSADAEADWSWLRWLPHARLDVPGAPVGQIGNDPSSRDERIKELLKLLEQRTEQTAERQRGAGDTWVPAVVVVLDGVRALRALPGVPRLLREGPRHGIYAIGLDDDAARLAEEGRAEVVINPDGLLATVGIDGQAPVEAVLLDQVDAAWAEGVARGLAPLRDAGGEEGGATIPAAVRFTDLLGVDLDSPEDVTARWSASGRTTSAVVGVSIDGPFALDLRRDGPHALVAGTTGSGKSEFLQTLVASLAVANRPDAINFVLVDYKGASAFADCADLPHTVGMVTNLDGGETQRALASLDAELRRRERELQVLRAPDIDVAWERDPPAAAAAGLARLVLVIDEFAELVHELPDFVTGLIRIARLGRSLGVHLILATQRPTGVVSGEMRANTGLRVGLRMEDAADSTEVLESPHAAGISRSTPGRAFARTGGGASVVQFQSARVAGRRKGTSEGLPPPRAQVIGWARLGYPTGIVAARDEVRSHATDLHALVAVVNQAATGLGLPPGRSPWLAPLPTLLDTSTLVAGDEEGKGPALPAVAFGVEDAPANQAQVPARFDLVNGSHLVVAGSARSGRSTLLRTLAGQLAATISPADVHVYGLDFGNGALLPLAALPHCGAVVARSEAERVERLLARLIDELVRRQELLARGGFADAGEQRAAVAADDRLPYLVVFLDRWEGFASAYPVESGSTLPADLTRLAREGPAAGVRLVVSGDRSLLTDRITAHIEDRLVLRLNDRDDYRQAGLNPRHLRAEIGPGRAFRAGEGTEVQVAVLASPTADGVGPDPGGPAQAAALRAVAAGAEQRWPGPHANRPIRVDVMPAEIELGAVAGMVRGGRSQLPAEARGSASGMWALLGVGGDELDALGVDLVATPGFVVAGPPRTGRSTTLRTMAVSLLAGGTEVIAVCPRPSPLGDLAGAPGVLATLSDLADAAGFADAAGRAGGRLAVLVDDADVVARSNLDTAIRRPAARLHGAGRGGGRRSHRGVEERAARPGRRGSPQPGGDPVQPLLQLRRRPRRHPAAPGDDRSHACRPGGADDRR